MGCFFLSLGPAAVNGVLGKSHGDGPAIIISGRQPTLEDCLVAFTTARIGDVRQSAKSIDASIRPADTACEGAEEQLTMRPLEYYVFGTTITRAQASGLDGRFYAEFTERLNHARETGAPRAVIIAEMFARVLYGDTADDDTDYWHGTALEERCRFLGQRWQEWIDAEKQGLVLYENQNDPSVQQTTGSPGFGTCFDHNARRYKDVLSRQFHLPRSADAADDGRTSRPGQPGKHDTAVTFTRTLQAIAAMPKRSDACVCIDRADLPEGESAPRETEADGSKNATRPVTKVGKPELSRQLLRDWYQFVYQKTMAQHLGAYLVAVSAPNNSFARLAGDESRRSSLMLSGNITRQLGRMPFVLFATFCYQSQPIIRAWRECNADMNARVQKICTRNVAYAVDQACRQKSLKDDGKDMLWGALIAGILALVSAMTDNVWLNGNAPIWLIVLAAWFIGIVPDLIDISKWVWGVRSSFKTVVYLE